MMFNLEESEKIINTPQAIQEMKDFLVAVGEPFEMDDDSYMLAARVNDVYMRWSDQFYQHVKKQIGHDIENYALTPEYLLELAEFIEGKEMEYGVWTESAFIGKALKKAVSGIGAVITAVPRGIVSAGNKIGIVNDTKKQKINDTIKKGGRVVAGVALAAGAVAGAVVAAPHLKGIAQKAGGKIKEMGSVKDAVMKAQGNTGITGGLTKTSADKINEDPNNSSFIPEPDGVMIPQHMLAQEAVEQAERGKKINFAELINQAGTVLGSPQATMMTNALGITDKPILSKGKDILDDVIKDVEKNKTNEKIVGSMPLIIGAVVLVVIMAVLLMKK